MKYLEFEYKNIEDFNNLIKFKIYRTINVEFFDASKVNNTSSFENRLINTVSAFSNNIGGLIILGLKSKRKKAFELNFIKNKEINKEYIENLLSFNIKPALNDIEIIEFNGDTGNLFSIKVKRSKLAPHISSDSHYYTRQDDKTVLMSENDIRNLFTVNNNPELEFVGVINTGGIPILQDGKIERMSFFPKFLIKNSGSQIERFYKIEISIPTELHDVSSSIIQDYFARFDGGMTVFSITGKSPIFQNENYAIAEAKLTVVEKHYNIFENGYIEINLFYSQGTKSAIIDLKNTFLYNRRLVEIENFVNFQKISQ
jgi:hypothetical protein